MAKKDKEINIDKFCIDDIFNMLKKLKDKIRKKKEIKKTKEDGGYYEIEL
mgnify:CR=1 FL=1